jgi:hypothetical protein
MRRAAARGIRAGRIDRAVPFLYVGNLPFHIHHERGTVGHAQLGDEETVGRDDFAVEEIAQQRESGAELGGKFFLGGSVIGTDAKNFCFVCVKFCNTSLVCGDFLRSTTGESCRKERQDHGILTAEAGKRHLSALS